MSFKESIKDTYPYNRDGCNTGTVENWYRFRFFSYSYIFCYSTKSSDRILVFQHQRVLVKHLQREKLGATWRIQLTGSESKALLK